MVAIGASAGGYEAFAQLLAALPTDTGMAFVLIQHLDPSHPSMLSSMLAKSTSMPVREIKSGLRPAPDHVYVMPSGMDLGLSGGKLSLVSRGEPSQPHLPIDSFFRALAAEQGAQAIGVILSGTGTDGTAGLQAIKAEGGLALVQDPATAKFGAMPGHALASGVVDLCLAIPAIAAELARLAHHPYLARVPATAPTPAEDQEDLQRLFALVRTSLAVDLAEYKEASIRRRLGRRMALSRVETLGEYLAVVQRTPGEDRALLEDILIHVTSFFRDPAIYETLRQRVFPEIVKHKRPDAPVRVWVAGCSTGQESYSIAIALQEFLSESGSGTRMQVFGSDVSEVAIGKARAGIYPESIAAEMSPERLRRFFSKVEGGYCISKAIREACVFVRHDLARDPAFSHVDLITCRNVLIYFNQALQRRVFGAFHYSLNVPGFLLLGRSENVLGPQDLFSPLVKADKVFIRNADAGLRLTGLRNAMARPPGIPGAAPTPGPPAVQVDVARHVDHLLLAQYVPPGVLVNDRLEVLQFRGHTGPFLEPPPGEPQLNLLKMTRPALLPDVRIAVARAVRESATARRDRIEIAYEGTVRTCAVVVAPVTGLPESPERLFTVLFQVDAARPARRDKTRGRPARGTPEAGPVTRLAEELAATKEYLQSLIGDHQKANDALAAANEELASGNEELQSVNEELETAKEELQSTNEELTTLNDELHDRNLELGQVNSDLENVLNSVAIPMMMLDAKRCIRSATEGARRLMNILPTDIGRPVDQIRPRIALEHLDQMVTEVMQSGELKELEVEDRDGTWHRVQIRPYRTPGDAIDGTVVSFVDIDQLRRAIGVAEWARDYAAGVVEAVPTPLAVLDADFSVLSVNRAFYQFLRVTPEETVGRRLFEVGTRQLDTPHLRRVLAGIVQEPAHMEEILLDADMPGWGRRKLLLSARPIQSQVSGAVILVSFEDVTDRTDREEQRATMLRASRAAELRAEEASAAKDRFLAVVSHELRTPLSSLLLHVELLRQAHHADPSIVRVAEGIERAARTQAQLIDDLLDVSRISSGKLELNRSEVGLPDVIRDAVALVRPMAEQKTVELRVTLSDANLPVWGDAARLRQVIWNLLMNAVKFTPAGGRVTLTAGATGDQAHIEVRDTGVGIEAAFLERLFEPFAQAHDGSARLHGGLGLGLSIVRDVVESHGGSVHAESAGPDQGARFTVFLPLDQSTGRTAGASPPAHSSVAAASRLPALDGVRVLLVEDEEGTRDPLAAMLAQRGAEVRATSSVAEALAVFPEFGPHVLVSDVGLPGEDGYSLIRRIRRLSRQDGGRTPAVALTAFARATDRREALDAGFDVHLPKPINFERLAAKVLDLFRSGTHHSRMRRSSDETPSPVAVRDSGAPA